MARHLNKEKGSVVAYLIMALVLFGLLTVSVTQGSRKAAESSKTNDLVATIVADIKTIEAQINNCVLLYPQNADVNADGNVDATDNPNIPFPVYNAAPWYGAAGVPITQVNCPGAPAATRLLFDSKSPGKFLKLLKTSGITITYLSDGVEGVRVVIGRTGAVPANWNDAIDKAKARFTSCQAAASSSLIGCTTNHCLAYWFKRLPTSYDPDGAGACGSASSSTCDYTTLAVGQQCPYEDVVYAGVNTLGNRIYARSVDQGYGVKWAQAMTTVSGASSASDGVANTNLLVALADAGAPYSAAILCRNMGAAWYLPAYLEMSVLSAARNTGAFAGSFSFGNYFTSTEHSMSEAKSQNPGFGGGQDVKTATLNRVRCVRR